ncbi:MAG: hypothetical protein II961_08620 [Candidatus Riflebacteria bacterium]|nr:hypothetical protein [Candidatus Riflebacteria bacterium]
MNYKILALSVASVIGVSSIVLSSNNDEMEQYLYGNKRSFTQTDQTKDLIGSDNTFTKGDMLAFNWDSGDKKDDEEVDSEEAGNLLDSEEESDDDEEEVESQEEIKDSGRKRKSHDMSVESGKHGKSHNLLEDAFFYIPEGTVLPEDGLRHTRNVGLAKTLRGSICVCTFFVSEKNWQNDQYHKLYKQNLEIAEKWLTREAKKYGSIISFENVYPLGDSSIPIDKIYGLNETDPNAYGSFLKVLESMEISGKEFKKRLRYETACENIVTNFVIDKDGRSYCFLDYQGSGEDSFMDFTWIYKTGWGKVNPPGVIAHEMLHAFGAFDLYERENYRKEQSNAVKKNYPDEIMYTADYENINKSYISPITAWKVGIGEKSKALDFYVPDGWSFD